MTRSPDEAIELVASPSQIASPPRDGSPPGGGAAVAVDRVRVDDAGVVGEVTDAFLRYEAALVAGDLPVLAELFWDDEATVRYGVDDAQMGAAALRRWRSEQPSLPPGRELVDTRVTTFDASCASVTTCFRYPGRAMVGRQSQMWVRFPTGWRIVSAHVSEIAVPRGTGAPT